MNEKIEQKLIHEVQKGSIEAFDKLITMYERNIYAICLRMLANEQEAYDATQEVCIKVWRQMRQFEGQSKFSTWLYRIATNQCLDMIRKKKRRDEVSLYQENKETGEEVTYDGPDSELPVEGYIEQMELKDILSKALGELKTEYREIIVLRDMQECSYDEISILLEINIGTVKSRLSRARHALKKVLCQNKEPYKSFFRQIAKKEGIR